MHALVTCACLRRHCLRFALAATFAACVAPSEPPAGSWDAHFVLHVYDARGVEQPFSSVPRRPEFVLSSSRALAEANLLLFSGAPDAALLEDLAGLPLRAASESRLVEARARAGPLALALQPLAALARAGHYSLALPGSVHLRAGPALADAGPGFIVDLRVADTPQAGAAWLLSSPAAGASGVPTNLASVAGVFDGAIAGSETGIWLEDSDGLAIATELEVRPCAELEAHGESCFLLHTQAPLRASASYRVRSGSDLRDAHGAPIETLDASFRCADGPDLEPPRFEELHCLRDEQALALGCALLDDRSLELRLHALEAVRVRIRSGERQGAAISANGTLQMRLEGLAPDEAFDVELQAFDLAGNVSEAELALRTAPELATLTISEVRADPAGPEPAQEYVELWNFGRRALPLRGVSLVDAADEHPSVIEHDAQLPAGARALLVAEGFDPENPLDPAPPPGTLLVRLGPSLTRAGLANAGERLFLRDAAQHRLSAAPMRAAKGQCLQRRGDDMRSGGKEAFELGDCSPGD
ncbi:MAG TPA: hypothetical protein VJV78_22510 [Polyangiales bacterium]|nr:hypothetical protein [Polyangiales bacterium]